MPHYVYMLKSISHIKNKTYVGYTINYKDRLLKHNTGTGAKSTKGYKWVIIYKRLFLSKTRALKFEYELKKNRKKRLSILKEYNDSDC
jgi:putative endonuclease|tara:strand:- start:198 stop:461 length:264 start_codon:yes stop_codon:yes gene_type:complete